MKKFILYYSQPTIENGKIVAGKTWYVRENQGEGGVDFGYTDDPSKARPQGKRAWYAFKRTHGARAQFREIE